MKQLSMEQAEKSNQAGRYDDRFSYRILLTLCFLLLLPIAILASLLAWRWHPWPPGPQGYGSPVKEAIAMASVAVGTAFSI